MNWFDILALLANAASLIGLILTLLVYRSVKRLQEHYTLIGRVPEVAKRLDALTLQLAQQLPQQSSTVAQRQELIKTLSQMEAALGSIGQNIGAGEGAAYFKLHDRIRRARQEGKLNSKTLENIYGEATQLVDRALYAAEDRKHKLAP